MLAVSIAISPESNRVCRSALSPNPPKGCGMANWIRYERRRGQGFGALIPRDLRGVRGLTATEGEILRARVGAGGRDYQGRWQQWTVVARPGAGMPGKWVSWGRVRRQRRHQEGSGRARSRVMAPRSWVSQGQCWGRCRVRRRALRVMRPAREKKRRLRVLVVTIRSPRPVPGGPPGQVMGDDLDGQARRHWRRTALRGGD